MLKNFDKNLSVKKSPKQKVSMYKIKYFVLRKFVRSWEIHRKIKSIQYSKARQNSENANFKPVLKFLSTVLRKIQQHTIINVHPSSCQVLVIILKFQLNVNFLDKFFENPKISNFMKIHPVGAECFHADGITDGHDKANSGLSKFCKGS